MAPALRMRRASASGSPVAISTCSAAMRSASGARLVERAQQDDGAEGLPAGAGDVAARQGRELAGDGGLDLAGEPGVVGHEDGLRGGVVLGLRQQVGGQPLGIVVRSRR